MDEGFGNGLVPLTQSGYTALEFKHESLILGHTYKYRVRAENLMGFGTLSSEFSYIPRSVPKRPSAPPRNLVAQTTR